MYAIVKTGGKQYKVASGDIVAVEKIDGPVGTEVALPALLLVDGEMRIRGYYHGSDPADLERLADDARHLAPARSG